MMLDEQVHVARVVILFLSFEPFDLRKCLLVERGHDDIVRICVVCRNAGHHVRDDQSLQVLLVREGVFECEDSAPGVAEQEEVVVIEAQGLPNLLDFVDETWDFPQFGLVRLVAVS